MVVIVNAGDTVAPAATVTVPGTVAAALLLISVTTAPPAGAGPLKVTVFKVRELPLVTVAADKVKACAVTGVGRMVKVDRLPDPAAVVTVTVGVPIVAVGNMVNTAVICVALTTTTFETLIAGSLTETTAPDTKLVPVRVTGTVLLCVAVAGEIEVRVTGPDSTIVKDWPPTMIVPA